MNTNKIILAFCLILFLLPQHSVAQYLFLDSSLTISSPTTFDSVRITSTGRLTVDDSIAVLGNMTIDSGGIVTHSLRLLSGLRLNVLGTLEIKSSGLIDVSSKGLLGGKPMIGGGRGETYNSAGDSIVPGATGSDNTGGGGSYGGRGGKGGQGGVSNEPYGLVEDVQHLGAGGGGNRYFWGGHGGGLIKIQANVCIINGVIRANGGEGSAGFDNSGGGSGGGIRMHVANLFGTGSIEAIGGAAYSWDIGGCGGGGRIAIFYDSMNIPVANLKAFSGTGGATASAGTIYLKDNAQVFGNVIIGNNNIDCPYFTPWRTGLLNIQTMTIKNRAKLQTFSINNTIFGKINIESNSVLLLDTSTAVQTPVVHISGGTLTTNVDRAFPVETDLQITSGGTFNVQNNSTLSVGVFDTTNMRSGTINIQEGCRLDITSNTAMIGTGVTLVKDGYFGINDSIQTLNILNGGVVTHSTRLLNGLRLRVLDTLNIKTGGLINVSGKGLLGGHSTTFYGGPGETYNTNDSIVAGAMGAERMCAGGSYGGRGADASTVIISNAPYGLIEEPRHLGSGGGGNRYFDGGKGGGRITLNSNVCINDGGIKANGESGSSGFDPSGGGSGGAILVNVGTLSGTGVIEANGGAGNAYTYSSGSGGGGRIAVYYNENNFQVDNIRAWGGSGSGVKASAGTIYIKKSGESSGKVIIDNNNINCSLYSPWLSGLTTIESLVVKKAGKLEIRDEIKIVGQFLVESNGKIGRP